MHTTGPCCAAPRACARCEHCIAYAGAPAREHQQAPRRQTASSFVGLQCWALSCSGWLPCCTPCLLQAQKPHRRYTPHGAPHCCCVLVLTCRDVVRRCTDYLLSKTCTSARKPSQCDDAHVQVIHVTHARRGSQGQRRCPDGCTHCCRHMHGWWRLYLCIPPRRRLIGVIITRNCCNKTRVCVLPLPTRYQTMMRLQAVNCGNYVYSLSSVAALHLGPLIIAHVLTAGVNPFKIALTVPCRALTHRGLMHRTAGEVSVLVRDTHRKRRIANTLNTYIVISLLNRLCIQIIHTHK